MIKPISGADKALIGMKNGQFRMPKKALSQHDTKSSKPTFKLYH